MNEKVLPENKKQKSGFIIFALMAGYSMVYMDKNMISTAILPIAKQYGLDAGQTGMIMSFFFLGYSLMQIPSGWLADKIGAKKVMMISLATISIFSFMFGAVSSLMLFMIIRFCAGIGHAGYPSSSSKSVSENFAAEKRTFVQSMVLSTSGIGGVLAFTLGANLIARNWRQAYLVLGILFALAFVLVWVAVPSNKIQNTVEKKKIKFTQVVGNRNVLVLFLAMILLNLMLYGIVSWMPSYLSESFGLSISKVGLLLAINAVFQTIGTIAAGALLSKTFLNKEKMFIVVSTIISALSVLFFLNSSNLILSLVLLIITSMSAVSAFTALFTWPHKILEQEVIGSAIGIINTGGTLGGFLSPLIMGQLIKQSDGAFTSAFIFMAVAVVLAGLSVFLLKIERK